MRTLRLLPLIACAAAAPLSAQTSADWVTKILEAANLPVSASEARREGASNEDLASILDVLRREKVPAGEARQVIDDERAARREHGPVDNFGAFVQSKLQSGLRGRDLAAAIHAEHAARGKGKGRREGQAADGEREGHGKAGNQRPDQDDRRPDAPVKPADRKGPAEGPGKPNN